MSDVQMIRSPTYVFLHTALALTDHWLLYVPPHLTLQYSTFCLQTTFTCYVWISEQTEVILLQMLTDWF